ncbi:conserved phage C-terminal domain-containing protein [Enterococcus hirae]|nr:conserved phage C-terminal domain-containing protein [Enterococcus hirae]EMF0217188.1 conserved phage C-terminal domain-containing protein [Enterococcus hirae]
MDKNILKQEDLLSKGYGIIPKLVMKDLKISAEAKAIYAYICSYCGAGDTAFPSVELICHDLGISEKRYQRHIKQLKENGYVIVTRNRIKSGFSNNIYTLPKTVAVQNVPVQSIPVQILPVQNVPTNINSLNNNNLNSNKKDNMSSSEKIPFKKIIDHLNQVTGSRFSSKSSDTQKHIKARWNEGNMLEDFISVIDIKNNQWKDNDDMRKYLRPSTLFSAKNFENYKGEAIVEKRKANQKEQVNDIDLHELDKLFGDDT